MRVFVAGATGATGRCFVREAELQGRHELALHVRPQSLERSGLSSDPRVRAFDLDDAPALAGALRGHDAVVSFVGTMRARFDAGDTYESSDVGTTRSLVAGALAAGVPRFLLLSSAGAGGIGAYLKMKGLCEQIVLESPLAGTVFRPSALVSPEGAPSGTHGERRAPPGMGALFGVARALPGLRGVADDWRPIPLDVVARAFLAVLGSPAPPGGSGADGKVLEGRDLWRLGSRGA